VGGAVTARQRRRNRTKTIQRLIRGVIPRFRWLHSFDDWTVYDEAHTRHPSRLRSKRRRHLLRSMGLTPESVL
jgi:hypothetical protein